MSIRAATGYVAHVLLAVYWLWVVSSTTPQLRKGSRDRALAVRVTVVRTAGVAVTALVVGVIHFWATHWWHIPAVLAAAVAVAVPLRRRYRALVAAPRHRLTLGARVQRYGRRHPDTWNAVTVEVPLQRGRGPVGSAAVRPHSRHAGPA